MQKTKSKSLATKQGDAYGAKIKLKGTSDGAPLNVETNLRNTQKNKEKFVQNAKNNFNPQARLDLQTVEAWQMEIFKKNAELGYRFFQPDNFEKQTPRSAREAWGGIYHSEDKIEKDEKMTNRIMIGLAFVIVIVLSII